MKMTKETFDMLSERIAPFDTEERRQRYREGKIPRADVTKNFDVRYRWDLFYAATSNQTKEGAALSSAVRDEDLTSDHIDTALRRIVKML